MSEDIIISGLTELAPELLRPTGRPDFIFDNKKGPPNTVREVLTGFVVSEASDPSVGRLVHLINTIMKRLFGAYEKATGQRLYFLYRGGNIIRIYRDAFQNHVTGTARAYFESFFDAFFKRSDLDFYVIIDKAASRSHEELERIAEDAQCLAYEGLCYAREQIMRDPTAFIDITRYSGRYMDKLLGELLPSIRKEEPRVVGVGFDGHWTVLDDGVRPPDDASFFRRDFVVYPLSSGKVGLKQSDPPSRYHLIQASKKRPELGPLYVSTNTGIRNAREGMAFRLSRLMINFAVLLRQEGTTTVANTSSELYDVSIGLPDDKMFTVYDEHSFRKYHYGEQKEGTILIPTLEVCIKDLFTILFRYYDFPWEDPKYEKRLKRLVVLLFIRDLTTGGLTGVHACVKHLIKEVRDGAKGGGELPATITLERVSLLVGAVKRSAPKGIAAFRHFVTIILGTLKELDVVCKRVKEFMETDGQLYLLL